MKNNKTMDRMKAFQKILDEQSKEKMQFLEADDDEYDPVVDTLLEISDLLSEAADLSVEVAGMLKDKNPNETAIIHPYCVVEVRIDDEF